MSAAFSISCMFCVFFLITGVCTSCRTVEVCTSSIDSTTVAQHTTVADVNAEKELRELLQRFKENYTITVRDITVERDSSGNEKKTISEKEFRHSTVDESADVELTEQNDSHIESSDSTAQSVDKNYKSVEKDPPTPIPKIVTVVAILFLLYVRFLFHDN